MITAFDKMIGLRRTVRRFRQDLPVERGTLRSLVEAARLHPSGANKQPLVFIAVDDPEKVAAVNSCLKFGGYLAPDQKPTPDQAPTAQVVIAVRTELVLADTPRDVGAAAMTLLLGAVAHHLGGCWLRSVNYPKVAEILELDQGLEVDSVIALGYPAEAPRAVAMEDGEIKYWLDEEGILRVPKRDPEETLFLNGYGRGWD